MANKSRGWLALALISILITVTGLLIAPLTDIIDGMTAIIRSPSVLVTDYFLVGGPAAALVNAGLVSLVGALLVGIERAPVTGPIIAGYCNMLGFAFFGKNIVNILPVILGVHLYAWRRHHLRSSIIIAMFSTALAPLVSQLVFGFGFHPLVAIAAGIALGFLVPGIASQMLRSHQGFNLYNLGFAAGFLATAAASLLDAFGYEVAPSLYWSVVYSSQLSKTFLAVCLILLIAGWLIDKQSLWGMRELTRHPGALLTDFVVFEGLGTTLVNMGLMGIIGLTVVHAVGGTVNGPVLGALLTVIGFSALGKHPLNTVPVMLGTILLAVISPVLEPSHPGCLLAILFSTTLCPISGMFGAVYGAVAGMLHLAVVMNVGFLHGGMNLYNNGLAGGVVATLMVGILKHLKHDILED